MTYISIAMICSRTRAKKISGEPETKGAIPVNENYFFPEEIIGILKKRDWSSLEFYEQCNGLLGTLFYLYVNEKADEVEVSIHTPENTMDETADRVIDVLEHLDECIQRAYDWLSKHDLPYAWLLKYPMCELYFGAASVEPHSKKRVGGNFSLIFDMPEMGDNPSHCDVWFHYFDLQPYKSEKDFW